MELTRRQFVGGTAALAGATVLPSLMSAAPAVAADALPLTAVDPWIPLDPKAAGRVGWETYKGMFAPAQSACCEATYWGVVGQLAANYPDSWGKIPKGLFNYGGGGVNAWASICGCTNAGSAVLAQIGAPKNVKDNFMRWYEKTQLPTNAARIDYDSGTWTPGGKSAGVWGGATGCPIPWNGLPKSKSESVLCHVSVTKWRSAADRYMLAQNPVIDLQSNRCGALVYDACFYLATLINNWKSGATIDGAISPAASGSGCKASSCHGQVIADWAECDGVTAQGIMNCKPCHTGL